MTKGPPPRCLPQGPHHPRSTPDHCEYQVKVLIKYKYDMSYATICTTCSTFYSYVLLLVNTYDWNSLVQCIV